MRVFAPSWSSIESLVESVRQHHVARFRSRSTESHSGGRYLCSIRPASASGLIHPNPVTGLQYVDIRKQWKRLIEIASGILGYDLDDRKADFFTFRHTGASHLAEKRRRTRS